MRRNAALLLVARVVSAGTTLGVLALVARLRDPESLGVVAIGFALGAVAATISDGGSASLLVRETARRPGDTATLLGAGLLLRLVTVPTVLLVVALAAAAIAPDRVVVIVLVASGLVMQQVAEPSRAVFLARERMGISAGHSILENLAWLAVVTGGLVLGWTLEAVFALAFVVWLVSVVGGFGLVALLTGTVPALPSRARAAELVRIGAPFASFNVLGIAYSRLDTVLIGALATGPAVALAGSYFAAARLIAAFEYVPEAVSRAAYPVLSRRAAADAAAIAPLLDTTGAALLVLGFAVPVLLVVAGPTVFAILYGPRVTADAWLLVGLSLAVPARFLGFLYGTTLTSVDAQGRRVVSAGFALLVIVLVNVLLLPAFGLIVPVSATILAAVLVLTLYARFVHQRFGTIGLHPAVVTTVVGGAILAVAAGLGARTFVPEPIAAAIAAAVYLATVGLGPSRPVVRSLLRWPTAA